MTQAAGILIITLYDFCQDIPRHYIASSNMNSKGSQTQISSDAFTEIFFSMSEGLIMVDESGIVVVANPIAEQLFGYGSKELIGLKLESLLPERFRGNHINFRKGFFRNPSPRSMGTGRDLMALRKDGKEFAVEISLSYTRLKDELIVMAFISDISQRKQVEGALKRSEEQLILYASELEKKVQLRTEALNKTVIELEREVIERKKAEEETHKALEKERELNELKSKFVSLVSHEFRTPLSTILSSASLISQYNEKQEGDKIKKHVSRIKSSINHLITILNDLLSLGKLEEGKVHPQVEKIDLAAFLAEVKEELGSTLKAGQSIIVECERTEESLMSDPKILRSILFNLISNASKYSDEGKRIYIRCGSGEEEIVFRVIDEGMGIPEEDIKHIFERFFRAGNVTNIQGTGLGLNIVKRFVDLLDGRVYFNSEVGKGSTFTFTLPAP